jgi:Nif-specific regulatory protein
MTTEPDPLRKSRVADGPAEARPLSKAQELLGDRGVSALDRELLLRRLAENDERISGLSSRVEIYERLVKSAQALSSILDLDQLLGAILREVVNLCGVDRGFVLLADREGALRVEHGYDHQSGALDGNSDSALTGRVALEAFRQKKIKWLTDALNRAEFQNYETIHSLQLNTVVAVPLLARGGPIGVLDLDSQRPEALLRPEDGPILEGFAGHAAVALENAKLHREILEARAALERENRDLRRALPGAEGVGAILGKSKAIEELRRKIGQLQEVNSHVLIRGETGTGKELVARAIHAGSLRSNRPYYIMDCASVPRDLMESEFFGHKRGSFTGAIQDKQGLIEAADGGTLFLDEIGEMPMELQAKLLRAIEAMEYRRVGDTAVRKVDVRILSATNRDLETAIEMKEFRADLYYRLRVVTLTLPPLRERVEDILFLAEGFLKKNLEDMGKPYIGFTSAAVRFLLSYSWPGNVRELRNVIEGACAFLTPGRPIDSEDIRLVATARIAAPASNESAGLKQYKDDAERQILVETLDRHNWIVTRAAKAIGISRQHLHNRIKYHGLARPDGSLPQ